MSHIPFEFNFSVLGLEEISHELPKNISHVISLVDPGTTLPRSLEIISSERHLILQVHDALDSTNALSAPTRKDALALCFYADNIDQEHFSHLLVHCHMGRSRSAAATAIILVRLGICSPIEAFKCVRRVRDPVWPNRTLIEHGDDVMNCQGALLHACEDLYSHVRKCYPKWVEDPCPENLGT